MLNLTKGILEASNGFIKWLSKQLITHISGSIDGLFSLMMPIHAGQILRFEHVKKKLDQEVSSFEEKLNTILILIYREITSEMTKIIVSLDSHRVYVRERLEQYVKKIIRDLKNLKRWHFQYVHNDLYEFEYRLDQIERIVKGGGYGSENGLWRLSRKYENLSMSEKVAFADFLEKFFQLRNLSSSSSSKIEGIRERIKGIRSKLATLQTKIPDFKENDYNPSKLGAKIKDFKVRPNNLRPAIYSMNKQIGRVVEEFKKIQEKTKPLQESIRPIERCIDFELVSDIKKTIMNPSFNLDGVLERIASLGTAIIEASNKLEKSMGIYGYLRSTDPGAHFKYKEPTFGGFDNIDTFMHSIKNLIKKLENMDGWIKAGFRVLRKKDVLQFTSDEIRMELQWFEGDISEKTTKLKRKLEEYTTTLQSIKSIHEQLKEIKQIANEQDEAIREGMANGTLDTSSLQEIKRKIEAFVSIKSNIDKIDEWYKKKQNELKPIKGNVSQLKLLRPELLKLEFSINSDIVFAKIIENIIEGIKSLKTEAEKEFEKIENYIGNLTNNIKSIIKMLGSICCIIESIRSSRSVLNLNNLKHNLDDLRLYIVRLSQCIKATDELLDDLNYKISVLPKYMGKLSKIESRITMLRLQLMPLRFIERFPDLLFIPIGLGYIKKNHPFFEKIREYVKIALNTIELCRFILGITILDTNLTKLGVGCLVGKIKGSKDTITEKIQNVECSIESVIICLLQCSNESITNNTIKSTKGRLTNGAQVYKNEFTKSVPIDRNITGSEMNKNDNVWELLSNVAIFESKFVASNLYEKIERVMPIIMTHTWFVHCNCMNYFYKLDSGELDPSYKMTTVSEFIKNYKDAKYKKKVVLENEGNNICLCMVIRHILYPILVRFLGWLVDSDFDILSTMSRQFDKYTGSYTYYVAKSKTVVFAITIVERVVSVMDMKYSSESPQKWCFCIEPDDEYYKYFISSIIYISFLVENIFRVDESSVSNLVKQISSLYDQIYHDVSYYKRPKIVCPRNESCICLCSSQHICDCGEGNGKSVCDLCKNCKIVCLSICLLCCISKTFDGEGNCDESKSCGNEADKCCLCKDSDQISKCLKALSCSQNLGTISCGECSNSAGCEKACGCIKQLPENLKNVKTEFARCVLKTICNETECSQGQKNLSKSSCCIIIRYVIAMFINTCTRISDLLYSCFTISRLWYGGCTYIVVRNYIEHLSVLSIKEIVGITKNNRMYDSTNEISNKIFEGASNNYSYNDAYRINTSRAHGSLKYIIIKIVIILIIVVMTIFIRVKLETDDDYKIDNLLSEENGDTCECDSEDYLSERDNGNDKRSK